MSELENMTLLELRNFAKEQNINPIGSLYVLRQDQCNEKTLLGLLRQIWDDVFNS